MRFCLSVLFIFIFSAQSVYGAEAIPSLEGWLDMAVEEKADFVVEFVTEGEEARAQEIFEAAGDADAVGQALSGIIFCIDGAALMGQMFKNANVNVEGQKASIESIGITDNIIPRLTEECLNQMTSYKK